MAPLVFPAADQGAAMSAVGHAPRLSRSGYPARLASGWAFWTVLIATLGAILGFGGVYSYVWASADIAIFAALAVVLWRRVLARRELVWHPLLLPIAAFGILVLAQWALRLSVYPGATLTGLIQLAGDGAAFYLMLSACRGKDRLSRLGYVLWLFCGMLSVEAILQFFGANGYIYWFHNATYATPVGPFVYHNFYAGCMDLLLPVALVYSLRAERAPESQWVSWLRRGLVPALAIASIVISRSRGGVIIMLAEVILGVIVFWPDLKRRRGARLRLAVGAVLLAGFSLLAGWGPIARRFELLAGNDPSAIQRIAVTDSCWHIFLAHPGWGTGFGTFATVYPAYQTFDNGLIFQYAHNDYAQLLAETGVLGAVCALGFIALWAFAFWRRRGPGEGRGQARHLQLACFIGTAGFLLHSYGDFQFHSPGNTLLFFVLTAAAVGTTTAPAAMQHRHRIPGTER